MKLVSYSSTITMMHGLIYIRFKLWLWQKIVPNPCVSTYSPFSTNIYSERQGAVLYLQQFKIYVDGSVYSHTKTLLRSPLFSISCLEVYSFKVFFPSASAQTSCIFCCHERGFFFILRRTSLEAKARPPQPLAMGIKPESKSSNAKTCKYFRTSNRW